MKTYIKLAAILIVMVAATSCKKEGCMDPRALNFDGSADKNGTCQYTKAIFYAPSDRVGGTADRVVKIEISFGALPNDELVGTITTFNHPVPSGCVTPEGAFEFELPGSDVPYTFITRYYYDAGFNEPGDTYRIQADNSKQCELIEMTL